MARSTLPITVASTIPRRLASRRRSMERIWLSTTAETRLNPLFPGRMRTSLGCGGLAYYEVMELIWLSTTAETRLNQIFPGRMRTSLGCGGLAYYEVMERIWLSTTAETRLN